MEHEGRGEQLQRARTYYVRPVASVVLDSQYYYMHVLLHTWQDPIMSWAPYVSAFRFRGKKEGFIIDCKGNNNERGGCSAVQRVNSTESAVASSWTSQIHHPSHRALLQSVDSLAPWGTRARSERVYSGHSAGRERRMSLFCSLATNWVHGETTTFRDMVPLFRAYSNVAAVVTCNCVPQPQVKNLARTGTGRRRARSVCTYAYRLSV